MIPFKNLEKKNNKIIIVMETPLYNLFKAYEELETGDIPN